MRNKIITNLKSLDCDKNSHLLLAVSGGIDSMVMLHFFQQNKKQFKFSVAHINHNYHSESKKMENLFYLKKKKAKRFVGQKKKWNTFLACKNWNSSLTN